MKTGKNLRLRLIGWLLPTLLTLILVSASVAYFIALHVATSAYDQALLDSALAMSTHLSWTENRTQFDLPQIAQQVLLVDTADQIFFRIIGPSGEHVAGDKELPTPNDKVDTPTFYDANFRGQRVRIANLPVSLNSAPANRSLAFVQVAETMVKRDRLIREVLLGDVLPNLLIALATILLVWFGVARGLAPLNHLGQEIAQRSHRDLRAVAENLSPEETRPLVDAINDLLGRLRAAIVLQQRFIANAAHQLRTPLAAMLTQVELLDRSPMPTELQMQVAQLHRAIGNAAHLANQLLTLARAEPGEYNRAMLKPVDLSEIGESLVQEWVHRARIKNIDLGFELESTTVRGDTLLLRELIANLLDNAVKYTNAGGAATLRVTGGEFPTVEVEDNGIGIPEQARELVLERFQRIDGTPGEGSGLGLAIVREIADAHGAEIQISTPTSGRGTRVVVWFPTLAAG